MASPLGHALAGLALHVASARDEGDLRSPRRAVALVSLTLAADLDLLGRLVDGRSHHHGASHSLGLALAAAAAVWLWAAVRRWPRPMRAAWLAGAAWSLHGVVDFFSRDTTPPFGPMLLWPLSDRYWIAPFPLLLDTARTLTWSAVGTDLLAMAWEAAVLGSVLLVLWRMKRRRLRA